MTRLLALLIPLAVFVAACGDDEPTTWSLSAPADRTDTALRLVVLVGGCDELQRLEVREDESVVTIGAYVDDEARTNCDDGIFPEERTVQLREPLGDRTLRGCNPPSAIYGPAEQPGLNDDCELSLRPALRD